MKIVNKIPEIIKEMSISERRSLIAAGSYLKKKLKEKVSSKGISLPGNPPGRDKGDLIKGIDYQPIEHAVLVGVGPPAYHAHLLEFGTQLRTVKNYRGHEGVEVSSGKIEPRPFLVPTFDEEVEEVEKILSENW